MDPDQDFEAFLRQWAAARIVPTEDHLREFMAWARTIDLIQLSKEKGFRDNLMEIQKAYGSVLAYVKLLMRVVDFVRSRDSNESGEI
jgi:hypothetical protein